MSGSQAQRPYLLGLDLGVQSVGWTVLDLDGQNEPAVLRAAGVRCFDSGVGNETQIEQGKDESTNAARRMARQQRRQLFRRAQRLRRVFRVLQSAGLLPEGPAATPDQRHAMLLDLDKNLFAEHVAPGDRLAGHTLPYRLRAMALDHPLAAHALGRALYHLAQRRGFLSNKKAAKESDEDEGKVKEGIAQLYQAIDASGVRTLGEYFARLDPEEQRIRARWTARKMYLDEFEAIWNAQSPHHAALTPELKSRLHKAMFFQRPLKSQKGLIARCDLEPTERRAPKASLAAQRIRYLQKLNDLEIIDPQGECLPLSPEQRAKLTETFESQAEVSFSTMRKLLKLKAPRGDTPGYTFNLEAGGEKRLLGNRTAAKLSGILDGRWSAMDDAQREALVHEISIFQNEDALARRLVKAWDMAEQTAAQVAAVRLEPGYFELSLKAIRKLLPRLEAGQRLNEARKELYGERLIESDACDLLPPVLDAVKTLRNPVVCRALSELRKVVNALIRRYGKPAMVRVELARDMKRGRKAREDAYKQMRANQKRRDDAKKKSFDEMKIDQPRPGDILKVVLAEECNWECPYTGKRISMKALLGPNPQFDIEHIIPFSRSLDNSFLNKTLCYHEENRSVKRNKTPYEAYAHGDPDRWNAILQRVKAFQNDPRHRKLQQFRKEELDEDFVSRQLNDTRYMSRLAADYLGLLFGGRVDPEGKQRVQVSAGGVTGYLRDVWQLDQILQDPTLPDAIPADEPGKNRYDHRHHAVDAIVVGLAGPAMVKRLSQAAAAAEDRGHRLFVPVEEPWPNFRDQVRQAVAEIRVSYRVDRRISGALHQDTIYSKPRTILDDDGKPIQRHLVRKPLASMSTQEINAIVDPVVRHLVQDRLDELGGNPQKAFTDPNNHPYLKARDGRVIPIHKARFAKTITPIAVGPDSAKRYVPPGNNHHVEIIALLDNAGNETKWEGRLVSLYEATQRLARGEPVVGRDHGENRKFKFSLAGGEFVEMEHQPGAPRLYRVVGISANVLEFRLHTDARPSTVLRKMSRARVTRSPGALKEAKARKVALDPLGNVLPAYD